jgi:hypothetical protein
MSRISPDLQQQINQASQLVSRGDFAAAATLCKDALRARPDEPLLHICFGQSLQGLGQMEDAARCFQHMMAHWQQVLSQPMLEVCYEDLVASPEKVIRSLVEFCGLPWDERCLSFHDSERYVNTASYDQVRQPMYVRSVGRWKHYDRHLTSLREALGETANTL